MTHERKLRSALVLCTLIVIGACGSADRGGSSEGAPDGVLSGTVSYRERMALPDGAIVIVRLEDLAGADAQPDLLAEQTIPAQGRQVPIPFQLHYWTDRIEPGHRYTVRTEIRAADEKLLFTTAAAEPVLEHGAPADHLEIMLQRVGTDAAANTEAGSRDSNGVPR